MVKHELGKWNLDELAKNPNRKTIDRRLASIESDANKFESVKKSLNQNDSTYIASVKKILDKKKISYFFTF